MSGDAKHRVGPGKADESIALTKSGLSASGTVTRFIGAGIAIAISLYGVAQVSGMSTNTQEHVAIKQDVARTQEDVRGIEQKIDLLIRLVREQNMTKGNDNGCD